VFRTWFVRLVAAMLVASGLSCLPQSPQPWPSGAPARVTAQAPGRSTVASSDTAAARSSGQSRRSCRAGEPRRLAIPALAVDAPFERIGLDHTAEPDATGRLPLGNPSDRTRAGWYADGPRPGSGAGTVLTNGHTFRNGSAIFQEDFARRIALRQLIQLRQDNGSVCSYRVTRVWREISSARDYPRLVASEHLYNFAGPERLLLATCGGSWNAATQDYEGISVVLALPVNRS